MAFRAREAGEQLSPYDLVPYDYASMRHTELEAREPARALDKTAPYQSPRPDDRPVCRVCGYPSGNKGFIRMCFPFGHELFGRAICCPACWPAPFGWARNGTLTRKSEKIAALWEKIFADSGFDPLRWQEERRRHAQ